MSSSTSSSSSSEGKRSSANDTFDIVVYGATGFTGTLVAEYLCQKLVEKKDRDFAQVRWAVAGRSFKKLEAVVEACEKQFPEVKDKIGVIVADASDEKSLTNMCSKTRVVISTVGPFYKRGEALVGACVDNGCHYVDITGESCFAKAVIEKYGDAAEKKGAIYAQLFD